jgi:hypothetical protein
VKKKFFPDNPELSQAFDNLVKIRQMELAISERANVAKPKPPSPESLKNTEAQTIVVRKGMVIA